MNTALPAGETNAPGRIDEEDIRLTTGFADIFTAILLVVGGTLLGSISGLLVVAAAFALGIVTQIVQLVLMMLFFGMNMGTLSSNPESMFSGTTGILFILAVYIIPLAMGAAYYAAFHASSKQATLGKMAVGIKVVRTDGTRISMGRGVGRYFGFMLSSLIMGIGLLMAAFTERKQGLHDVICDTLVVDKHAYTGQPEGQREELGTVTIVILALAGLAVVGMIVLIAVMGAVLAGSGIR